MLMATLVASESKDPAKQVGCVLTDSRNRVLATGMNGPPRDFDENILEEDRLAITLHAEINALLDTDKGADIYNCYVWPVFPCSQCMAALAQRGVKRIVSKRPPSEKWRWDLTQRIAKRKSITLVQIESNNEISSNT